MKVALLYSYNPAESGPTEAEFSEWLEFDQRVRDAGIFVYEAGFQPHTEAKIVRVRDDGAEAEDGPATRTGAVMAGLYVLEVPTLDDALRWAQSVPTAKYGQVEVRPIVEF